MGNLFSPVAATPQAQQIDQMFLVILGICMFFFALTMLPMIYFVIRYRRRKGDMEPTEDISHNTNIEIFWTLVPTLILGVLFFASFNLYIDLRVPAANALEVFVTGKRWIWQFEYKNGLTRFNELVLPAGRDVKLTMKSEDVIHSFYVPNFRLKQDVVPNKYSVMPFTTPGGPSTHVLYCAEYCGTGHSDMTGIVTIKSPEDFEEWLATGGIDENDPPAVKGKAYFSAKACNSCHSIDGSKLTGPTFKGLWGRMEKFTDGTSGVVDENYFRESVYNPKAKIVDGYQNVMPSFVGQIEEEQIRWIMEYVKTLEE